MNRRRDYSTDDLTMFALHIEDRALAMPERCSGGAECWVLHGPPCITSDGVCRECRTLPVQLTIDGRVGRRRFLKQRKLRR